MAHVDWDAMNQTTFDPLRWCLCRKCGKPQLAVYNLCLSMGCGCSKSDKDIFYPNYLRLCDAYRTVIKEVRQ